MRPQIATFFVGRNIARSVRRIASVVLFLTISYCMGTSIAVHAASTQPLIGIKPAYFDPKQPISRAYFIFNTKPGVSIQNAVRVTNSGTVAGSATLYGTDATTGVTSGAIYLDQTVKPVDVGSWLTLSKSSLTLAPGQSVLVPFDLTLPQDARSGDHLGGIGMVVTPIGGQPKQGAGQGNTVQINTRIITVIAVEVILPGTPVNALSASGIVAGGENGYQSVQLDLHNTGTMMLKPFGTLVVMDTQGTVLQSLPIKLDTFLPMTSIPYPVYLKSALGAGNYQIALTLTYGDNQVLRYSTHFTVTPQQVQQAFPTTATQKAPVTSSALPWWIFALGGFFVLCGLLFLAQQGRRFAINVQTKRKDSGGSSI